MRDNNIMMDENIQDLLIRLAASLKEEDLIADPLLEQELQILLDSLKPNILDPKTIKELSSIEDKSKRFVYAMQALQVKPDLNSMKELAEAMQEAGLLNPGQISLPNQQNDLVEKSNIFDFIDSQYLMFKSIEDIDFSKLILYKENGFIKAAVPSKSLSKVDFFALKKSPALTDPAEAKSLGEEGSYKFDKKHDRHIASNSLKDGLYHHVFRDKQNPSKFVHVISNSKDHSEPTLATIEGTMDGEALNVDRSYVGKDFAGKNYGKMAYISALMYHGKLRSDNQTSAQADAAWSHMKNNVPGINVKYGSHNYGDRHSAVVRGDGSELKEHLGIKKTNINVFEDPWDQAKHEREHLDDFEDLAQSDSDDYVYHSTYLKNLPSIAKYGLGAFGSHSVSSAWSDIKNPQHTYFAKNPHDASNYAVTAENISEKDANNIITFKIHKKHLDPNHIHSDENILSDATNISYSKQIPSHHLEIHEDLTENQNAKNLWDSMMSKSEQLKKNIASENGLTKNVKQFYSPQYEKAKAVLSTLPDHHLDNQIHAISTLRQANLHHMADLIQLMNPNEYHDFVINHLSDDEDDNLQMSEQSNSLFYKLIKSENKIRLVHYSHLSGLTRLDPKFYGTGHRGAEHKRSASPRTFYYFEGTKPEDVIVQRAPHKYTAELPEGHRIYDMGTDPDNIIAQAEDKAKTRLVNPGVLSPEEKEDAVRSAGYHGFYNSKHPTIPNAVAYFHPLDVKEDTQMAKSFKEELLQKVGDGYKKLMANGVALIHPVKINGKEISNDGIPFHTTIKVFHPQNDRFQQAHNIATSLNLIPPDPKMTTVNPAIFKDRFGDDVHVLELGGDAERVIDSNSAFNGMGFPVKFKFKPHITIDLDTYNRALSENPQTAADFGISFDNAELRYGYDTYRKYPPKG